MPVTWKIESGNVLVFTISGTLEKEEYLQAQREAESAIESMGTIKVLIVLVNFSGWERAQGWDDLSFSDRNDRYIEKIAIVGDVKWQDLVYAFTLKGLRPVPIEYFDSKDKTSALEWIGEKKMQNI